ncbi:MAG: hypothetical protein A2293_00995 [Elusimicrobia bacterium RIFOXYB2_FULL_49_7]|nr:MAG: hypothetical protein A2293_00995 [Elusimicrobia bacterium RIFOXYB2_FULL_49_7]
MMPNEETRDKGDPIRLSVIIVSYNVSGYLDHCLDSVLKACAGFSHEIVVVDNASTDNTVEMVRRKYPEVRLIENAGNVGYSTANNQGIRIASGGYILLLNPDTLVTRDAFVASMAFLDARPQAGIMSVKIVNADGSFQPACRRGFPTPATAFYRMSGMSLLFPKSSRFGRYNMTYLDEDETAEVDALCGAYMMMRSDALKKVGGLDETFFMFGEDIDLCYRFKQAGFQVWYAPLSEIIHFKGKSSRKNRFQSAWNFYNSMIIFSRKYFSRQLSFFPKSLLFFGIFLNALFKVLGGWLVRALFPAVDLILINGALFMSLFLKFGQEGGFYTFTAVRWIVLLHASLSAIYLSVLAVSGAYSERGKMLSDYWKALFVAAPLFFSFIYFIPEIRFSRIAFTTTALFLFVAIPAWRFLLSLTPFPLPCGLIRGRRLAIVGTGPMAESIYGKFYCERNEKANFIGFFVLSGEKEGNRPACVPRLGGVDDIEKTVLQKRISDIVLASPEKEGIDTMQLIRFCAKKGIVLHMVQGMHEADKYFILDVTLSESVVL